MQSQRLVPDSTPFRSETSQTHDLASLELGIGIGTTQFIYVEWDYNLDVGNCVVEQPI